MGLSADKKRVAFSLSAQDVDKLKEIYASHSKDSCSRIYESDTLSEMISYVYNLEKRGANEWRK